MKKVGVRIMENPLYHFYICTKVDPPSPNVASQQSVVGIQLSTSGTRAQVIH